MDFDETLRELLGLMGTEVVGARALARQPRGAGADARQRARCARRPEVVEQLGGSSEVFFCRIGNGPMLSGFFLDRERFRSARWERASSS